MGRQYIWKKEKGAPKRKRRVVLKKEDKGTKRQRK
jgi:hypothetical protein